MNQFKIINESFDKYFNVNKTLAESFNVEDFAKKLNKELENKKVYPIEIFPHTESNSITVTIGGSKKNPDHLKFRKTLDDIAKNLSIRYSIDDELSYGSKFDIDDVIYRVKFDNDLVEGTVKQGNSWVNKGKDGTHGKFKTKKAADAQRKAMFAKGFKESLTRNNVHDMMYDLIDKGYINIKELAKHLIYWLTDDDLLRFVKVNAYDSFFEDDEIDESLGSNLSEYQEWVDYDMKRFGKISEQTQREIDEAGLQIVKDKFGDYQVIAKGDKLREAKEGTYYYINNELSEKDAFYRSLRNTGADYIDSDKLRKGITIDNTKFQIRTTPIDEAMDISGIKGTIANAFTQHKGEFNKATTPSEILKIANDILVEEGVNIDAPSVTKFLNLLQKSKTLNNSLAIVYNYILAGSGQNVI